MMCESASCIGRVAYAMLATIRRMTTVRPGCSASRETPSASRETGDEADQNRCAQQSTERIDAPHDLVDRPDGQGGGADDRERGCDPPRRVEYEPDDCYDDPNRQRRVRTLSDRDPARSAIAEEPA